MSYSDVCAFCLPQKVFVEDGRHVGQGHEPAADADRRDAGHPVAPIELSGEGVQRTMLDAVIAHVRKAAPEAAYLDLSTTDQNTGYGFVLGGLEDAQGKDLLPDYFDFTHPLVNLGDELADWLYDLNWNGVVGEGYGGYARIDLRTGVTVDAS
jgi:hypothetical protein